MELDGEARRAVKNRKIQSTAFKVPQAATMNPPAIPPLAPTENTEATLPFSEIYNLLTHHHQTTGSLNLPPSHPTTLRIIDILSSLQFEKLMDERWESQFGKLKAYKSTHGNCAVETMSQQEGGTANFSQWIGLQRDCYRGYEEGQSASHSLGDQASKDPLGIRPIEKTGEKRPCLSTERYLKLKNVGLTVNKWEKRLVELRQFKADVGHCECAVQYILWFGLTICTRLAYRCNSQ